MKETVAMANPSFRINKNIVFVLLLLAYFFSYFFRISTSVVLPGLQEEWGLSAALVGFISSMYFYTYAIMQPFCGALNDRFGPVRIVGAGMALTCIGSALFGLAASPSLLILGRLLQGVGLSPMISGLFVYQGTKYPPAMYTFLSGITLMVGNFGAVIAVYPLSAALTAWSRSSVFYMLAFVTFLITVGLFTAAFANKNEKTDESFRPMPPAPPAVNLRGQIREAFGIIKASPDLTRIMAIWAIIMGAILTLQGLWAVAWFDAAYKPEGNTASLAATMIGIGVMAGNMLGGRIGKPGKRHVAVRGCAFFTTASWMLMLACFGLRLPLPLTAAVTTCVGIGTGVGLVQFASSQNALTPAGRGGGVFGIINTLNFIAGIVFQWGTGVIISIVVSLLGPENAQAGYLVAHAVIGGFMILACCIAVRIKPFA